MQGFNRSFFLGNLTKKPELTKFESGKTKTTVTIAVNDPYGNTAYPTVEFWNKNAENIAKHLSKGSLVLVECTYKTSKFEKDGETIYQSIHSGNSITFLDSKKKASDLPSHSENPDDEVPATDDQKKALTKLVKAGKLDKIPKEQWEKLSKGEAGRLITSAN